MAKILVVGDVMLDRYWYGQVSRLSQEAPVPVVNDMYHVDHPGGAANVAVNVAELGQECILLGVVGRDEAGAILGSLLEVPKLRANLVEIEGMDTVQKARVVAGGQQIVRMDVDADFYGHAGDLLFHFEQAVNECEIVIFADYGKGTLKNIRQMIKMAKGKTILVDPYGNDWIKYAGATLIKPNGREWEQFSKDKLTPPEVIDLLQIRSMLITRGQDGMELYHDGMRALIRAEAHEVFDVTGAGDTVIAALACGLLVYEDMLEATKFANMCAGVVVGKPGTASVTKYDLLPYDDNKQKSLDELVEIAAVCTEYGERIVMTNGCFDLLHSGHIRMLQAAKAHGDRLIVAVNSNASVRRLKGNDRPVNDELDRCEILAALECVDYVILFEDETPQKLVEAIKPHVLVKGSDYEGKFIAGAEFVKSMGGEVVLIEMTAGKSTTSIINSIKRK